MLNIEKMPKVELHCHLDGSIRPETIKKLAEQYGVPFPNTQEEIENLLVAPENTRDLLEYLEKFDYVIKLLQTTEALELAAYDVISQAAEDNVKYIEVRFAPNLHTQNGLKHPDIVAAVLRGMNKGAQDFGLKCNALLCGLRHEELAEIEKIAHLAKKFLNSGVVGFDLAGDEIDHPPFCFEQVLALACKMEIPITLHAGECGCGKNVYDAVYLGAKRIGHGIALKDTPEYFDYIRERDIVIEMAPTSNFQTKAVTNIADYPFKKFLDADIKICINTDNRTVSNTTLNKEYAKLAQWYDLKVADFEKVNHNAIFGAFISEHEKDELHQNLHDEYAKLL